MPPQTQSAYISPMVKHFKFRGVSYELLQRVGDHVQLQIKVHAKTQIFWLHTKSEKKVVRVGRGFKPARGSIPGKSQWKIEPYAPKPIKAKRKAAPIDVAPVEAVPVAMPAVVSKLEQVVREACVARYGDVPNLQTIAFCALGEKLGFTPEFLAGLAVAEGVVVPTFDAIEHTAQPEN